MTRSNALPAHSTSALALAAALAATVAAPHAAKAQAIQGTFSADPTRAAFSTAIVDGKPVDTINVITPTAVVNWTPFDTAAGSDPILLLDKEATALFVRDVDTFTVLNRVVPTGAATDRAIRIDGTVLSRVSGNPSGTVMFYSPNGIVIGPSGTFDVGSLVLSTLEHPNFSDGSIDLGTGPDPVSAYGTDIDSGSYLPTRPGSFIEVQQGALLRSRGVAAYTALVSPRVVQRGTIESSGSAALIAAEQVTVTVRPTGLFDISFVVGTGDANGVVHDGKTGGPTKTAADPDGRVYMAAVPKAQVMQMLLGGEIGFEANAASVLGNGAVILSAGYGVASGTQQIVFNPSSTADMAITSQTAPARVTSVLSAAAQRSLTIDARTAPVDMAEDSFLYGQDSISVLADGANGLVGAKNLSFQSDGLIRFTHTAQPGDAPTVIATDLLVGSGGNILGDAGSLVEARRDLFVQSLNESVTFDKVVAGDDIEIIGGAGNDTLAPIDAITIADGRATGLGTDTEGDGSNIRLFASDQVNTDSLDAVDNILIRATGGFVPLAGFIDGTGKLTAGGAITLYAKTGITGTSQLIAPVVNLGGRSITLDEVNSQTTLRTVDEFGAITSTTSLETAAGVAINTLTLRDAGGTLLDANISSIDIAVGTANAANINFAGGGTIRLDNTPGALAVSLLGGQVRSSGTISALSVEMSGSNVEFATITPVAGALAADGGAVRITASDGSIIGGNVRNFATTGGIISLDASDNVEVGDLDGQWIEVLAGANVTTGVLTSSTATPNFIRAGNDITIADTALSGALELTSTNGNVTATRLTSAPPVTIDAAGTVTIGEQTGGDLTAIGADIVGLGPMANGTGGIMDLTSRSGDITLDAVSTGTLTISSAGALTYGSLLANGTGTINAAGAGTGGAIASTTDSLDIGFGGSSTVGAVTAALDINMGVTGDLAYDEITAGRVLTLSVADAATGNLAATNGGRLRGGQGASINAGTLAAGDIEGGSGSLLVDTGGFLTANSATAGDSLALFIGTTATVSGPVTARDELFVSTGGDASLGAVAIQAGGTDGEGDGFNIGIFSGGTLAVGGATAPTPGAVPVPGSTVLESVGDMTVSGSVTRRQTQTELRSTTGGITVNAPVFGASLVDAATDISVTTTGIAAQEHGTLTAGGAVTLTAAGGITASDVVQANGSVSATANGDIALASVTSDAGAITLRTLDTGAVTTAGLTALTGLTIDGRAPSESVRSISTGTITVSQGDVLLDAVNSIATGAIQAANGSLALFKSAATGSITTGLLTVGNDFTLGSGGDASFAGISVGDDIRITVGGTLDTGNLETTTGGTDDEGDGHNIVVTGNVARTGSLAFTSAGTITVNGMLSATGGAITLTAGGTLFVDHAETDGSFLATATRFETGPNTIITGGDIDLDIAGDIVLGNSQAGGFLRARASAGSVSFGTMTAGTDMTLEATGTVTGTSATAGGTLLVRSLLDLDIGSAAAGGILSVGLNDYNGTGSVNLDSGSAGETLALFNLGAGAITAGTLEADGSTLVLGGDGAITITSATARGTVPQTGGDGLLIFGGSGLPEPTGDIFVASSGPVSVASADAARMLGLRGNGVTSTGTLSAGVDIHIESSAGASLAVLRAGDDIIADAAGALAIADAATDGTGPDDTAIYTTFTADLPFFVMGFDTPAGSDVTLRTTGPDGSMTLGAIAAHDTLDSLSSTATSFDSLAAGGDLFARATGTLTGGSAEAGGQALLDASGIATGDVTAGTGASLVSASTLAAGAVSTTSGNVALTGATGIDAGDLTATTGAVLLSNPAGTIATGVVTSLDSFVLDTTSLVDLGGATSTGGGIAIGSTQGVTTGNLTATGGLQQPGTVIASGTSLVTGNVTAPEDVTLTATTGALATGSVSGATLVLSAGTTLDTGSLTANSGDIAVFAGGAMFVSHAEAVGNFFASANSFATDGNTIITEGDITVFTSGDVDLGNSQAGGFLFAGSGGNLSFGSISAGLTTNLFAQGDVSGTASTSAGDLTIDAGGNVAIGTATANGTATGPNANGPFDGNIFILANGGVQLDAATARLMIGVRGATQVSGTGAWQAGEDMLILSDGTVDLGSLTAGNQIDVEAPGGITLGSATTLGTGPEDRFLELFLNSESSYQISSGLTPPDIRLTASAGAVSFGTLDAAADLVVNAGDGISGGSLVAGRDVLMIGEAGIAAGDVQAGRSVDLGGPASGPLALGNITAGTGSISLQALGGIATGDITALNGPITLANTGGAIATGLITAGSDFTLTTDSPLAIAGITAGDDIRVTTSGTATFGDLYATGTGQDDEPDGSNIVLVAGGSLYVDHGEAVDDFSANAASFATGDNTIITGGDILVVTSGDADLGNSRAGGLISVIAGGAGLFGATESGGSTAWQVGTILTGTSALAGGAFSASAGSDVTLGTIDAASAAISAGGGAQVQALDVSGAATIGAAGPVSLVQGTVGTNLGLLSSAGAVLAPDLTVGGSVTASGTGVTLGSPAGLTVASALASQGGVLIDVQGVLALTGAAIGETVELRSSDIAIAPDAQVGALDRTSEVILVNNGLRRTYIGGNGGTSGDYGLSNAELQRVHARSILIDAPPVSSTGSSGSALSTREPDVILGRLDLTAAAPSAGPTAGNMADTGTFRIQTGGKLRTIGVAGFSGLAATGRVEIDAFDMIEIDPATGGIHLRGSGSAPGGQLALGSRAVAAASPSALADIASLPTLRDISTRLGLNDSGEVNDLGVLSADGITVFVRDAFYLQNTGQSATNPFTGFDQRRGFTAGSAGMTVFTQGAATRVAINGRLIDGAGLFVTGLRAIPEVAFENEFSSTAEPGLLFDADSTINGCAILRATACQIGLTQPNEPREGVDVITEGTPDVSLMPLALIQFSPRIDPAGSPVIDDPVTGAGNDDLWGDGGDEEEE